MTFLSKNDVRSFFNKGSVSGTVDTITVCSGAFSRNGLIRWISMADDPLITRVTFLGKSILLTDSLIIIFISATLLSSLTLIMIKGVAS